MTRILIVLFLTLGLACHALGEDTFPAYSPQQAEQQQIQPAPTDNEYLKTQADLIILKMENERYYVLALSLLSVVMFTVSFMFLRHKEYDTSDIIHLAGLNIIIFGTIILVLVVETNEQLTAAIGVLGAIAGYLFRSLQEKEKANTLSQAGNGSNESGNAPDPQSRTRG
ncbi:hypothetical protein WCX49_04610 [Sulfurimonas sp. HSL-1656]|uniref:hypothetical protein n=1 Tax=Thiomicrolovo subterrani TaxID=3131934 RepID=UPI0031F7BC18